jgi:hypothetical protein
VRIEPRSIVAAQRYRLPDGDLIVAVLASSWWAADLRALGPGICSVRPCYRPAAHAFARSTSRSAAALRASGPSCSPARRRPAIAVRCVSAAFEDVRRSSSGLTEHPVEVRRGDPRRGPMHDGLVIARAIVAAWDQWLVSNSLTAPEPYPWPDANAGRAPTPVPRRVTCGQRQSRPRGSNEWAAEHHVTAITAARRTPVRSAPRRSRPPSAIMAPRWIADGEVEQRGPRVAHRAITWPGQACRAR